MTMNAGFPQNPLHVANMAQRMAENSEGTNSLMFQRVAMVSMGLVAVASAVQVLAPLLKDLNHKHEHHNKQEHPKGGDRSR
jgi:hypothetical protein